MRKCERRKKNVRKGNGVEEIGMVLRKIAEKGKREKRIYRARNLIKKKLM